MTDPIVAVDDRGFDAVLVADERPVLVDFTATWCGPCKVLHPDLERLAREQAHRLRVVSVDADTVFVPYRRYGVHSMPNLLLLDGTTPIARLSGDPEHLHRVVAVLDARERLDEPLRPDPLGTPSYPARTLTFPDTAPIGLSLFLVPSDGPLTDKKYQEMRGEVEVPAGWLTDVVAYLPPDPDAGVMDTSCLLALPAGAVDQFTALSRAFGDEQLAAVARLRGLRELLLRDHSVTGAGLAELAALDDLRVLHVDAPDSDASDASGSSASGASGASGAGASGSASGDSGVLADLRERNPWLAVNDIWRHPQLRPALGDW